MFGHCEIFQAEISGPYNSDNNSKNFLVNIKIMYTAMAIFKKAIDKHEYCSIKTASSLKVLYTQAKIYFYSYDNFCLQLTNIYDVS